VADRLDVAGIVDVGDRLMGHGGSAVKHTDRPGV
jgi:hypothetical protein